MPVPVSRYSRQTTLQELYLQGPLIQVTVSLPEEVKKLRGRDEEITITALIDTGATDTCISGTVAQKLGLVSIERVQTLGVHGVGESNRYSVNFTFTGSNIRLNDWPVTEFNTSGRIDMLIGRDVLSLSLFVYGGSYGAMGLEIPGVQIPDWVSGATQELPSVIPKQARAPSRNRKERRKAEKLARREQRKKR
jgi:predicted aspartyl protease